MAVIISDSGHVCPIIRRLEFLLLRCGFGLGLSQNSIFSPRLDILNLAAQLGWDELGK